MPPTDGQVVLSTPPPANNKSDSNAALAANSALSVPFSCNFCQRSFPRLSLLKKHEQVTRLRNSRDGQKKLIGLGFCVFFDRRTATRCRSVATFACDSSSTRDPAIATSNSTRAIRNIVASTARPPSHAGQSNYFSYKSRQNLQKKVGKTKTRSSLIVD